MTRILPGGRGAKYGKDSSIVSRESYDERTTRLPKTNTWSLSNFGHPIASLSAVSGTANRIVFAPVPVIYQETVLHEARMTVTTSQASTTMRAAIYKYRGRSGGFIKVSGSDALFQGTSTGSQTYELAGNPSINANEHYMIGVLLSGGTLAVLGKQDADGGIVSPSYMDYGSAGVLPTNVPLSSLTKDATEAVPAVCYLSKESAEVM